MCAKLGFLGLSGGGGGGLSEVVAVDPRKCHPIPEKLLPYAALLEPLAVARHAINLLGLEDAAFKRLNILVLGGGPIGLAVIHNLLVKGATNIFVSEPSQVRREQTASLVHVIDPTTKSVPQFCMESTNNVGMDVVFDCAGIARALKDAIGAIRSKGKYINVAVWHGVVSGYLSESRTNQVASRGLTRALSADRTAHASLHVQGGCLPVFDGL